MVVYTAGNKNMWLRQRKEWSELHNLGICLMFLWCLIIPATVCASYWLVFFCLKPVWRSATYLEFIMHSNLHKWRLQFSTHFVWFKLWIKNIISSYFGAKFHWLALVFRDNITITVISTTDIYRNLLTLTTCPFGLSMVFCFNSTTFHHPAIIT